MKVHILIKTYYRDTLVVTAYKSRRAAMREKKKYARPPIGLEKLNGRTTKARLEAIMMAKIPQFVEVVTRRIRA